MLTAMGQQLVGAAELGTLFGVSRQRVTQLTSHTDFPPPVAELRMGKVWSLADIESWADERGRALHPLDAKTGE